MTTRADLIVDVDRYTGALVSGWERCRQSITCILTTRLRTRLMRLWWGSEFMTMQDEPGNEETFARSIVAAADAINRWEPEFKVVSILIEEWGPDGRCLIEIDGVYLPDLSQQRLRELL